MRAIVLVLAVFAGTLGSCGQRDAAAPAPPGAASPAPSATDFARPLNALGNEPFWSLKIRPGGLSFSAPGASDVTAPNPGPQVTTDQAVWSATGGDGKPLKATFKTAVCQDAMSGANYPFTATVEIGGRSLRGCGAYAGAMPRPGG